MITAEQLAADRAALKCLRRQSGPVAVALKYIAETKLLQVENAALRAELDKLKGKP